VGPPSLQAGPPYLTDDPEPVAYQHWELYLATQALVTRAAVTGTAPHVELNCGVWPGVQLHAIIPLTYTRARGGPTRYGLGDMELGAKLRFVEEGAFVPMVAAFPLLSVPTGNAARGLGSGQLKLFLPLWFQKSFGPVNTYGGGGYHINPGSDAKNSWFLGWMAQCHLGDMVTPGAELYYATPDRVAGRSAFGFNLGLVLDLTAQHHILLSAGRDFVGETHLQVYGAYQMTW
jgi:hypothetical protein